MRIGALRVPSDDCRQYRRAEGLASGVTVKVTLVRILRIAGSCRGAGVGVGPGGRRIGAPPPAECRGAAARRPRYMSLCGERAPRAVVTDSQWRRRPTVCPTAGTAARVAPPRCTPPAPLALCPPRSAPLLPSHYTRPAPKNFPHRAGKIDCAASPE